MIPLVVTLLAAITPAVLLITYFTANHRFPQPRKVIWATFVLGIAAVVPVTAAEVGIHTLLTAQVVEPLRFAFYKSFLALAIPEELMKFVILRYFCMRAARFTVPKDGVVYGAVASLGFSMFESVFYFAAAGLSWYMLVARGLMAVPMHVAVGVIMGLSLVSLRVSGVRQHRTYLLALIGPVVLHAIYNFFLLLPPYAFEPGPLQFVHGPQAAVGVEVAAAIVAFLQFRRLTVRLGLAADGKAG